VRLLALLGLEVDRARDAFFVGMAEVGVLEKPTTLGNWDRDVYLRTSCLTAMLNLQLVEFGRVGR
jgi:hypothetical protein